MKEEAALSPRQGPRASEEGPRGLGPEWLKQKRVWELGVGVHGGTSVELGTRLAEYCKVPWRNLDTPQSSGPSGMEAPSVHPRSLCTTAVPGLLLKRNLWKMEAQPRASWITQAQNSPTVGLEIT